MSPDPAAGGRGSDDAALPVDDGSAAVVVPATCRVADSGSDEMASGRVLGIAGGEACGGAAVVPVGVIVDPVGAIVDPVGAIVAPVGAAGAPLGVAAGVAAGREGGVVGDRRTPGADGAGDAGVLADACDTGCVGGALGCRAPRPASAAARCGDRRSSSSASRRAAARAAACAATGLSLASGTTDPMAAVSL
jgi:hypothetical protein